MKNLDLLSRRILSASIAIAVVLLSLSLFLISLDMVNPVKADDLDKNWTHHIDISEMENITKADQAVNQDDPEEEIKAIQAFGIGIREGNLYFGILYSNNSIGLHKAPAEGEDVLDW